jgi:hypothetical protein
MTDLTNPGALPKKIHIREVANMPKESLTNWADVDQYQQRQCHVEQGKDSQHPPGVELADREPPVPRPYSPRPAVQQNPGNEKTAEHEEQIHAHHAPLESKLVRWHPVRPNHRGHRQGSQAVELGHMQAAGQLGAHQLFTAFRAAPRQ